MVAFVIGHSLRAMTRPRRSLFLKYFMALFVAVVVPLIAWRRGSEVWFGYRDQRRHLKRSCFR